MTFSTAVVSRWSAEIWSIIMATTNRPNNILSIRRITVWRLCKPQIRLGSVLFPDFITTHAFRICNNNTATTNVTYILFCRVIKVTESVGWTDGCFGLLVSWEEYQQCTIKLIEYIHWIPIQNKNCIKYFWLRSPTQLFTLNHSEI